MSPDSQPVPFRYAERIVSGEIRVLEFLGRDQGETRLKLKTTKIPLLHPGSDGSCVPYCTLSYCWGPEQPRTEILLDSASFTVAPNLAKALAFLERRLNVPIWIDAICINQSDDVEKAGQLGQMGDVYRYSRKTTIWLGDGDAATDRMMQHLEVLRKSAFESGVMILKQGDAQKWPAFEESSDVTVEAKQKIRYEVERIISDVEARRTSFDRRDLASLVQLTYRDWFSRVWIVQELCLSENFEFSCGKETVTGDYFLTGLQLCNIWTLGKIRDWGGWPWHRKIYHAPSLILQTVRHMRGQRVLLSARASTTLGTRGRFRKAQEQDQLSEKFSLKHNLVRAHAPMDGDSLAATVCKDRVYAMLGISGDAKALDIPIHYHEDYTHQELFTLVTKKLLQRGHVDLLSYCRPNAQYVRDEFLPSWVPDWTQPLAVPWEQAADDELFNASNGQPEQLDFEVNDRTDANYVRLGAYKVGEVSDSLDLDILPDGTRGDPLMRNRLVMKMVDLLLQRTGDRYTMEQRMAGKWRIPIADREYNDLGQVVRATEKSEREYEDVCQMYSSFLAQFTKFGRVTSYLGHLADNAHRTMIMLDDKSIGLAPAGTRKGDEVWIPRGAHVPYVFRGAANGQYSLLGSAFVYGSMDGEVFRSDRQVRCQALTLV